MFFHAFTTRRFARAVLADVNPRLIGMYQAVRDSPEDVLEALLDLPEDRSWKDSYATIRDAYNASTDGLVPQAARLLWLNRAGYNGLYRENRKGHFNVAPGDYETLRLVEMEELFAASSLLQHADIRCCSFEDVLREVKDGDAIFADPPYVSLAGEKNFVGYSKDGFGPQQQEALRDLLVDAGIEGACAVLTNHDSPESRALYSSDLGFQYEEMLVARNISRDTTTRTPARELLVRIGPL